MKLYVLFPACSLYSRMSYDKHLSVVEVAQFTENLVFCITFAALGAQTGYGKHYTILFVMKEIR